MLADQLRQGAQGLVTLLMTMAIIECLEVIRIDHQDRQRLPRTLGAQPFLLQRLVQCSSVGQSCKGVDGCQLSQFLFSSVAASQFAAQQPGEPEQTDAQRAGSATDQQCRALP
ncbi:hypothetical protein D3C84_886700 [compost metagenome]